MHGWIIIDKPLGPGSTQIVSAVKRALRTGGYGKYKVGHGGTLDPLASGVLPVAIGEATKLSGRMLDADKAYDFTIGFGIETDTLDAEGKAVATSDERPTRAAYAHTRPNSGAKSARPAAPAARLIGRIRVRTGRGSGRIRGRAVRRRVLARRCARPTGRAVYILFAMLIARAQFVVLAGLRIDHGATLA